MSLPICLLVGGQAGRLGPLSKTTPKALQLIHGEPFLALQLAALKARGFRDVVLCVGHLGDHIRQQIGDGHGSGLTITYVDDGTTPKGTGGAIRLALPVKAPAFYVLYGDVLIDFDPVELENRLIDSDDLGVMGVTTQHGERHNVECTAHRVVRYDPDSLDASLNAIDAGISMFRAAAFTEWSKGLSFSLGRVFQRLVARHSLGAVMLPGPVHQIGTPDGLEAVRAALTR